MLTQSLSGHRLLKVYPSEEEALTAIGRNSAIVLPYLNKPTFISGTWKVTSRQR